MADDSLAQVIAGLICFGLWAVAAVGAGAVAQWRTRRVEAELRRRAEPPRERVMLFYAGASVVWLVALVLALVGFLRRDWTRLGRNCLFIFLGQISLLVALVPIVMPGPEAGAADGILPLLILACSVVAVSALLAAFFASRWALVRARRIEGQPSSGAAAVGGVRYLLYAGSLAIWPVGLVGVLLFREPENVRVGTTSFLCSLVNTVVIALAVCLALPLLAHSFV